VAHRLRTALRAADIVGRLGGDEFVVVCRELTDPARAGEVADRIARTLPEPVAVGDAVVVPRASLGTAWTFDAATGAEDLLAAADASMYAAKARRAH
jgi:diguanylate cyclase (GGDEF)-like protein